MDLKTKSHIEKFEISLFCCRLFLDWGIESTPLPTSARVKIEMLLFEPTGKFLKFLQAYFMKELFNIIFFFNLPYIKLNNWLIKGKWDIIS